MLSLACTLSPAQSASVACKLMCTSEPVKCSAVYVERMGRQTALIASNSTCLTKTEENNAGDMAPGGAGKCGRTSRTRTQAHQGAPHPLGYPQCVPCMLCNLTQATSPPFHNLRSMHAHACMELGARCRSAQCGVAAYGQLLLAEGSMFGWHPLLVKLVLGEEE